MSDSAPPGVSVSVEEHWRDLVTTALLGTDRRPAPEPPGPLTDLVADTGRAVPSERMLALVAACTAVRRAGLRPGPALGQLAPPEPDDRPPCPVAAVERWHHITRSWPVLEDEWVLTLIGRGWRAAPELVPAMLARHRADPVRRMRAMLAAGALGEWLVEHVADLAPRRQLAAVSPEELGEPAPLPIPADLAALLGRPGHEVAPVLVAGLTGGGWGPPHRAVLINLVARIEPAGLAVVAEALGSVDPGAPGHGLAAPLADLAVTRDRMLAELRR